jgi:hypothetical protein
VLTVSKYFLILPAFLALKSLCELPTDGFCLQKIQASDLCYNPQWDTPPLEGDELRNISALLDQPYTLIDYGSECFAFASQDGTCVLKLYILSAGRYLYFRRGLFVEDHQKNAGSISHNKLLQLPLPAPFGGWLKRVLGMREYRLNRTFLSTASAYKDLKEETGLLYVHLNDTSSFKKKLRIVDKLGIAYEIDLDTAKFALQKKAIPLALYLQNSDEASAKRCLDSYLENIAARCKKGYTDRDILMQNFGVLKEQLIEIDVGSFAFDPRMQEEAQIRKELFFSTRHLSQWLEQENPALNNYLLERLSQKTCISGLDANTGKSPIAPRASI